METRVHFSVLRELGVLFEAPGASEIHDLPPYGAPAEGLDHAFHAHTPLWSYEHPLVLEPFADKDLPPVCESLPASTSLETVLAKTRLVVFLGAADTPALRRCLDQPETFLLILEPDARRLAQFAARFPAARLARRALILLGEAEAFLPPVAQILPPELFGLGFPVFYSLPEMAETAQAVRLVELVEILFYRHRMYFLGSQSNFNSLPIRPLVRGLFYDQQLHSYVNAVECLRWPDIRPLRKAFQGETAVLVAAGPDLPEHLDYLRQVRERAVVIAVNNALKPLLAAGVRPHFVVANDTSVHTGRSWEGLPHLPDVHLVGHCLTDLGGKVFGRKYLFGNYMPELFGTRPDLRLHGSVITTAFSLARHMGCARCVFVGAQLCSPDPWSLSYARGSIHGAEPEVQPEVQVENQAEAQPEAQAARVLTNAWPQLAPVIALDGQVRYTTLNFLDAAHWLRDEIRTSSVPCVSITGETIISGPGVEHISDCPVEDTGRLGRRLARAAAARAPEIALQPVLAFLRRDLEVWRSVALGAEGLLGRRGDEFIGPALQALERFDQGNVTYLVQRFGDFNNQHFHWALFQSGKPEDKVWSLYYYLRNVMLMARTFAQTLEQCLARLGAPV